MTPQAPSSTSAAIAETILVIEDDILIRMVIAQYLRECGYRVVEAANADEAILVLSQPDLRIDIAFTDVEMPGSMDGFGLAQWIRQRRKGVEVILAGSVSRAAEAAGDLCESGPMLAKPYEPQHIIDHIRRLLADRANRK
jgi:CheY-like chemotaxis protein